MDVSNFVSDIIDKIIGEMKQESNMKKIENNLIDPLIHYTFKKLFPYLMLISIVFFLTFLLAVSILLLQVTQINKMVNI